MHDRRDGRRTRLLGIVAIVVGVLGALVLWFVAGQRYDDAVKALAPAPVGCDTTLVFDRTGTYTFFVETRGEVGQIDGDCDNDDRAYDVGGDDTPRVDLTLVDGRGDEVDLDRAGDSLSYDRAGAAGAAVRTAEIDAEGDYVLTVSSDQDEVMVRVGRDPSNGVTAMRVGAVAVLLLGLVVGVVALVKGRSQPFTPAGQGFGPTSPWWPQPGPPPIAPPYANPPVPPPYGTPRPHGPPPGSSFPPPRPPQG